MGKFFLLFDARLILRARQEVVIDNGKIVVIQLCLLLYYVPPSK